MTDETLAAKTSDLDTLVTDIEGAASALAGLNSEEVPHECGHGRAWLAGEISGLVNKLRELTDDLFEAAHGPQPSIKVVETGEARSPAKEPISRKERLRQIFGPEDVAAHMSPERHQRLGEITAEVIAEMDARHQRDPDSDPAA